jgi:hypothetical protein
MTPPFTEHLGAARSTGAAPEPRTLRPAPSSGDPTAARNGIFTRPCPACASAAAAPFQAAEPGWCASCSDPRTGIVRGWVWRWAWLQRTLVTARNVEFERRYGVP